MNLKARWRQLNFLEITLTEHSYETQSFQPFFIAHSGLLYGVLPMCGVGELHICLIYAVRFGKWVTFGRRQYGIQRSKIYAVRLLN